MAGPQNTTLYRMVEGRHGRFLANPNDIYIGRSMIAYGEYSEQEWNLLEQMLRPGAVVVEAGANMGALTVPIARKMGPKGLVYAFEPQILVFQQLCANLALNGLVNVQAVNAGCGRAARWMPVRRHNPASQLNFGGLGLDHLEGAAPTRIRVERLDEAIDPPSLDLIKADVEGMEADVLAGAEGLIRRFRPVLYVEAHDPVKAPALIRLMRDLDYHLYWHLPALYNAENHCNVSENLFGNITSKNILAVPAERGTTVDGARPVADENDHPRHWPRAKEPQ